MADTQKIPTRDDIRSAIFASKKLASEQVNFFGQQIELRQPRLSDIISIQQSEDRQSAIVDTLIRYAYIPGTDEKIFEEGDTAGLLQLPFGQDMIDVSAALERLTKVNFRDGSESSGKT